MHIDAGLAIQTVPRQLQRNADMIFTVLDLVHGNYPAFSHRFSVERITLSQERIVIVVYVRCSRCGQRKLTDVPLIDH